MIDNDHGHGWDMGHGLGYGMGAGGWLMMALVVLTSLALIGSLLYVFLRRSSPPADRRNPQIQPDPGRSAAELTLDARFARGEIDLPEYEERRNALTQR